MFHVKHHRSMGAVCDIQQLHVQNLWSPKPIFGSCVFEYNSRKELKVTVFEKGRGLKRGTGLQAQIVASLAVQDVGYYEKRNE